MGKVFAFSLLLANLMVLKCQEEIIEDLLAEPDTTTGNPSYSYSYGVTDVNTGDVKTVWEAREGDSVQGQYSVLEPDGSMRTVEYSSNPKSGFTAVVNKDDNKEKRSEGRSIIEDKAMREYGKYFDFSEDGEVDTYSNEKKRGKYSYDTGSKKRPKYPIDLDTSSDFSHSITIKHHRDQTGAESESHSHYESDPKFKSKRKKPNIYTNVDESYGTKIHDYKYPIFSPDTYRDDFEQYESSNNDFEKYASPFAGKVPKFESSDFDKMYPYGMNGKLPKLEDFKPSQPVTKYKYPFVPDMPEGYYHDDPPRPRKKKPHKRPEYHYPSDEEEYWVPKKKKKIPTRFAEPEYLPEVEDDFDRPRYPSDFQDDDDDERLHRYPHRPQKEVIRKIVKKKKKPVFNLLDILDI